MKIPIVEKQISHFALTVLIIAGTGWGNASASSSATSMVSSTIVGRVEDAASGQPLGWVDMVVEELKTAVQTGPEGTFALTHVPPGTWSLRSIRVGYRDALRRITLVDGDTLRLVVRMTHSVVELEDVEVRAKRDSSGFVHDPVTEVSGRELERQLGLTVAESVDEEPGIAQRSMGPAPARPVLRGLSGDRLMILEDGQQTGDLSSTSSDHAVAIDPMTVDKIEVLRGPETFLYGSGALGGVINVDRKIIPANRPDHIGGTATLTGESVNLARGAGVTLDAPVGPLALRLDGSLRRSLDVNTPDGVMRNTGTYTGNGVIGIGWNIKDITAGVAAEKYSSDYGIPGGFVGAHPNGVDISMRRRHTAFRTAWTPGFSALSRVDLEGDLNEYSHAEYESSGELGMGFDVTTADLDVRTLFGNHGVFTRGAAGVSLENREYKTSGLTFTPASRERSAAIYLFEERNIAPWRIQVSIRADRREVRPDQERTSLIIGDISNRDFQGLSGAVSVQRVVHPGWSVNLSAIRFWRAPMVEELFSEGPHLAAYSYEIGNSRLDPERGIGVELGVKLRRARVEGRAAVYLNQFDHYIFPSNTGRFSARRADLYEYQYEGVPVQMHGAEGNLRVELSEHWDLNMTGSYVWGERRTNGVPLPMIPPLSGTLGFDHHLSNWTLNFDFHGAAAQHRVDEFERPTSAWLRVDLGVQAQQVILGALHTVSLELRNAGNASYRQHLSRIKVILPEPGRNVRFVYRVHF